VHNESIINHLLQVILLGSGKSTAALKNASGTRKWILHTPSLSHIILTLALALTLYTFIHYLGSGKSTAALKIANGSRKWTIVCQDVLGTRNKVLEGKGQVRVRVS
jgi:branched-subunit amino acid permease